jgi:hypothetical protein
LLLNATVGLNVDRPLIRAGLILISAIPGTGEASNSIQAMKMLKRFRLHIYVIGVFIYAKQRNLILRDQDTVNH